VPASPRVDPACLPKPADSAEPGEPTKAIDTQPLIPIAPVQTRRSVFFHDEELRLSPEIQDLTRNAYESDRVVQSTLKALATRQTRRPDITLADYESKESLLFYRNRLYILENDDLKGKTNLSSP
jgi:hypothetical protein